MPETFPARLSLPASLSGLIRESCAPGSLKPLPILVAAPADTAQPLEPTGRPVTSDWLADPTIATGGTTVAFGLEIPEDTPYVHAGAAEDSSPFGSAAVNLRDVEATIEDDPFDIGPGRHRTPDGNPTAAGPTTWGAAEDLQDEEVPVHATGPGFTDTPVPAAGAIDPELITETAQASLPDVIPAFDSAAALEATPDLSGFDPSRYFGNQPAVIREEEPQRPATDDSSPSAEPRADTPLGFDPNQPRAQHDAKTIMQMLRELNSLNS